MTIEPKRPDVLVLRRIDLERHDDQALLLPRLWQLLGSVSILESRRDVESSFRAGDLLRLASYGLLYEAAHLDEIPQHADLTLVLVVGSSTPGLLDEIQRMGWVRTPLGDGYARIEGAAHMTYVVSTDELPKAERREYLRLFNNRPTLPGDATTWLQQFMRETKIKLIDFDELPGFMDLFKKALAGLPIEERLTGLTPQQLILALPLETLRALPEEHLCELTDEVQEQIRKRLEKAAH